MALLLRRANPTFTNSKFLQFCRPASSSATLASATSFKERSVVSPANKSCIDIDKLVKIVDKELHRLQNARGPSLTDIRAKLRQIEGIDKWPRSRPGINCLGGRRDRYKAEREKKDYMYMIHKRAKRKLAWMESLKEFLQN